MAVSSLDPVTGEVYWEQPYRVGAGMSVATPVLDGVRLLVSSFYNGSMMLVLDDEVPRSELLWKGTSDNEILTDGLHAVVNTPVIDGDYVYGICSYGQFRALDATTGERVWETQAVTGERARWASGFMVRHGERYFINNDRGELIIARVTPEGVRGNQPHSVDHPDHPTGEPARARRGELVPSGVREPARLGAQRRGADSGLAGGGGLRVGRGRSMRRRYTTNGAGGVMVAGLAAAVADYRRH